MNYDAVVLTGASGAIGSCMLEGLQSGDCRRRFAVFSRETSLQRFMERTGSAAGVTPIVADLRSDDCLPILRAALAGCGPTAFIHAAADVSWTKSMVAISDLNIEGARRIASLAIEGDTRNGLMMFSTAYAHRSNGVLLNSYEESKLRAERAVLEQFGDRLGFGILRPTLVVGASTTGRISRYNGVYPLVRVIAYGELPCIVGDPDYGVDLIPVDWVADEALALLRRLDREPSPVVATLSAGDQRVRLKGLVRMIRERVEIHFAQWDVPAPPPISIIKRRQFDFLMRAAPSWDLEERFEQVRRISDLMAGYLNHVDDATHFVCKNTVRPCPARDDYLPQAIDFWLNDNRERLMKSRSPSWAN
jgi:nucleoside-diphosphate-sugar epimerase